MTIVICKIAIPSVVLTVIVVTMALAFATTIGKGPCVMYRRAPTIAEACNVGNALSTTKDCRIRASVNPRIKHRKCGR